MNIDSKGPSQILSVCSIVFLSDSSSQHCWARMLPPGPFYALFKLILLFALHFWQMLETHLLWNSNMTACSICHMKYCPGRDGAGWAKQKISAVMGHNIVPSMWDHLEKTWLVINTEETITAICLIVYFLSLVIKRFAFSSLKANLEIKKEQLSVGWLVGGRASQSKDQLFKLQTRLVKEDTRKLQWMYISNLAQVPGPISIS